MKTLNLLTQELKNSANTLTIEEAKYLVTIYYQIQELRKATENQCRAADKNYNEAHEMLHFFEENFKIVERQIRTALQKYAESQKVGQWLLQITGIGPVIAAGLISNIDIMKVETSGQIEAYCGLDPTKQWIKGRKRPWNPKLKKLCWLIGESFQKVSNNPKDVYGKIYKLRKEYEIKKNEKGDYAEQAKMKLQQCNIAKNTEAYKWYSKGKLPPAHINERSKRYAVKIFLSHMFEVWYEIARHKKPPKPYALDILNHTHNIQIPNWPLY